MFAPIGKYDPCGVFNITHLTATCICILLIISLVILSRNIQQVTFTKLIKIFAIVLTLLEIVKISYNLYYNLNSPINDWLPLHFCSLFIYSLWLSGFGKGNRTK